jgi:glycosyltransferase involved in cell wall biosynthesis
VRDAIVYGYDWAGAGPIERIALALARAGGKVLHCDSAASLLRRPDSRLRQLEENLFTFKPVVLGHRLNRFPGMSGIQGGAILRQILRHARTLGLKDPAFVYSNAGPYLHLFCKAMKARGSLLVHASQDYWESGGEEHVELSDFALVIPPMLTSRLQARWGQKVHQIPQGVDLRRYRGLRADAGQAPPALAAIPRPRLGYAGANAHEHLNTRVLRDLLQRHPEWSFVSFGWALASSDGPPAVPLPNAHLLPWQSPEGLARCVAAFDLGFMPYDCSNVVLYNGVSMKLFDYFALGLPVVATPILHLQGFKDLVYLGETAEELERAVEAALEEPRDSPKRQKREEVAEAHSIEALGRMLNGILG